MIYEKLINVCLTNNATLYLQIIGSDWERKVLAWHCHCHWHCKTSLQCQWTCGSTSGGIKGVIPSVRGSAPTCPQPEEKVAKISHFRPILGFLPPQNRICDMIKGNESDVGNIDFELQAERGDKFVWLLYIVFKVKDLFISPEPDVRLRWDLDQM